MSTFVHCLSLRFGHQKTTNKKGGLIASFNFFLPDSNGSMLSAYFKL